MKLEERKRSSRTENEDEFGIVFTVFSSVDMLDEGIILEVCFYHSEPVPIKPANVFVF